MNLVLMDMLHQIVVQYQIYILNKNGNKGRVLVDWFM